MAEGEGFEPPKPFGLTVFKTAAIDRSAILPWLYFAEKRFERQAKGGDIESRVAGEQVGSGTKYTERCDDPYEGLE